MANYDPAYIARADCGCIVAATIDRPQHRNDVARETADWIKRGYAVERTTVGEAKADPYFLVYPCPLNGDHSQLVLSATESAERSAE